MNQPPLSTDLSNRTKRTYLDLVKLSFFWRLEGCTSLLCLVTWAELGDLSFQPYVLGTNKIAVQELKFIIFFRLLPLSQQWPIVINLPR